MHVGWVLERRPHHKKDGFIYHYVFACTKYSGRDLFPPPLPERNRPVVGTQCKGMIGITDHVLNRWTIFQVHLEHNHELTPDFSMLIKTHREIPLRYPKELEAGCKNAFLSEHRPCNIPCRRIRQMHLHSRRCS